MFDKLRGMCLVTLCTSHSLVFLGTQGSIVVYISPLTSIMMDQKEKFTPRNLSTEFIGEQTDALAERKVQLVLILPESLLDVGLAGT